MGKGPAGEQLEPLSPAPLHRAIAIQRGPITAKGLETTQKSDQVAPARSFLGPWDRLGLQLPPLPWPLLMPCSQMKRDMLTSPPQGVSAFDDPSVSYPPPPELR